MSMSRLPLLTVVEPEWLIVNEDRANVFLTLHEVSLPLGQPQ
jgi:hypothetical protein